MRKNTIYFALILFLILTIHLPNAFAQYMAHTVLNHLGRVNDVAFSPDGSLIASGGNTLRLWEIPDTRVNITALPIDAGTIGDQLTFNINITEGESITGYQVGVRFDKTALRYVESVNGDYLPDDSFFVSPVMEEGGNTVMLGATSLAESSSGDGILAVLTFEFITVKESYVYLERTKLVNSTW